MRTYVRMVVCVHLPRFELLVAAGDDLRQVGRATLGGRALAVAPLSSGENGAAAGAGRLGEVSQGAEAHGVMRGMVLGEALSRCPDLVLRRRGLAPGRSLREFSILQGKFRISALDHASFP